MKIQLVPSKARQRAVEMMSIQRAAIDDLEVLDEFIVMCKKQRLKPVFWKKDGGERVEYTLDEMADIRHNPEHCNGEDVRPER